MKYVGIDIGGTNIKYGLLDEKGAILRKGITATPKKRREIIASITNIIENYKNEDTVTSVGISVPGVIDNKGYMITGGSLFELYNCDLKTVIETKIGLPVFVENDANSAILAEQWLGHGKDFADFILMVVGTGVGGSIIINNELYKGKNFSAGEFGFILVDDPFKSDARRSSLSLQGSVQSGLVDKYSSSDHHNGLEVYNLAEQGDQRAIEILEHFYNKLSQGVFNTIVSFDPEIVLIGGAISRNQKFIQELNKRVLSLKKSHPGLDNIEFPLIVSCKFNNDSGIIGAGYKAKIGLGID